MSAAHDSVHALRSTALGRDGRHRFEMLIPQSALGDPGVRALWIQEVLADGYEWATQRLLEATLRPGDLFIDVGAHWGLFALCAATLDPGIEVIAIEPDPVNLRQLRVNLAHNHQQRVTVVAAAASDRAGHAYLVPDSTMGHHLAPACGPRSRRVPRLRIDDLLGRRVLPPGRIFMKVDVEGHEAQVLSGARQLIGSGRLGGVIWEFGPWHRAPGAGERLRRALDLLHRQGFRQFQFADTDGDTGLRPLGDAPQIGNVVALAPDQPRPAQVRRPAAAACCEEVSARRGRFRINRNDLFIGRSLQCYGEYAEAELRLLDAVCRRGDTVVDAGANIGVHSQALSQRVGPSGRVHAFEPQPAMLELLRHNMDLNHCDNVVVHGVALGAGRGWLQMPRLRYDRPGNFGGVALRPAAAEAGIECRTLDSLQLSSLALLKADVEGMEAEVLAGAADTIRRLRPLLYLECDRRSLAPALIDRLRQWDYTVYRHTPALFNPDNAAGDSYNRFPGMVAVNLLALPAGCARRPPAHAGLRALQVSPRAGVNAADAVGGRTTRTSE